jgi:hypothetical protein
VQMPIVWPIFVGAGGGPGHPVASLSALQGPAGVVFAAAFFLAAWQPDGAWRRGVMLGLAVPLAHAVAAVTGHTLPFQVEPAAYTMFALVPAMIGTSVGVRVSRLRHTEPPTHH